MTNQAKDKIAPIKLKLSLSSALQSPTTRPDASVKGKGKAVEENGGGGHLPPVRLKLSHGLIRSISSHNNEPSTPTPHGTETGTKASTVNGASGLATPSTPNTLPESSTPSSSQFSRKKNGVSTPSVTKHGKVLGRPRGSTKKSKLSATPKASPSTKPSAVPPRLLSSGPSTPRVPPLTPSTPIRTSLPSVSPIPDGIQVKQEPDNDDVDPLSTPLSPSAMEMRTPGPEMPVEQLSSNHAYIPKATGGAVKRIKRPMKELMNKVMVELRRKDDYALFDEPVNLEDFPDYLGIVGGEDKMMDLGTMQSKIDNDDYDNFDQFKTDLETLAAAAEKFNPPGTVPHTSAQRVLAHGLKHIERNRPLVLTPTPSPEPEVQASDGTKTRGESILSGRGATMPPGSAKEPLEVGPMQYIPEEMLQYAPGSAIAQAVGWNLNGGRRQYARRQIRGREKFNGKWRHWALDGTRDLAEMDEPGEVFATQRMTEGSTSRRVIDWKGLRKDGNWWDFDIAGPSGQPPVHFSTFPRPAPLRQRDLTTNEWGVFPEIDAEVVVLSSRTRQSESSTLSDQLRPIKTHHRVHPLTPANFIDVYDDSAKPKHAERLRERVYGGVEGEAYHKSVSRFIDGAMESAARNQVGNVEEVDPESDPDHLSLREYVKEYWHSGLLRSTTVTTIDSTIRELKGLHETLSAGQILDQRQENLLQVVKMEHARQALLRITRPDHPLDIKPLLKEQGDFLCQGAGGRDGVKTGLEWVSNEIARMSKELEEKRLQNGKATSEVNGKVETEEGDANGKRKRESLDASGTEVKKLKMEENIGSTTSSPLSQAPDTPPSSTKPLDAPSSASPSVDPPKIGPHPLDRPPMPSKDDSLKRLRLELVALSKFYPLAALRKMDKSDAERLLPPNVRALMSKPEAKKPEAN